MSLSNSQYDELMRLYSRRQAENNRDLNERREAAYERIPLLRDMDQKMASFAVRSASMKLDGDEEGAASLRAKMRQISNRRKELLLSAGFPEDTLSMRYHCPCCQDTGYVSGQKCRCFKQAAVDLFYTQSGLKQILQVENFDTLRLDYYPDDAVHPSTGLTAQQNMQQIVRLCQTFVRDFDSAGGNLLIHGGVGLGKTFLTHCIARDLIETAHSVMYFSAFDLFEALAKETFSSRSSDDADPVSDYLFDCDLLIIDDLGTEMTNSFVTSRLFWILNERAARQKSTIISTNLPIAALTDTYSERVFSRIMSDFTLLGLYGDDIRLQKKLRTSKGEKLC